MPRFSLSMGILTCLVGTLPPVIAHHSFDAQYDRNLPATVTGTVTRIEWMNPHIYFFVDVEDENGTATNWAVEGAAPNGLYRRGWRRDTLKPGDEVRVEGWLARDGSNSMNSGIVVRLSDGLHLFAGSSNPDASDLER